MAYDRRTVIDYRRAAVALAALGAVSLSGCKDRVGDAMAVDRPPEPLLLAPGNGSTVAGARPEFRWAFVSWNEPVTYELEVDDSCLDGALAECSFASPEIRVGQLVRADFRPEEALDINADRPVGRRYFWRVRACSPRACSAWTRVRYVDVGRAAGDLNGDGLSDVVITAPLIDSGGDDRGSVFVYYGGADGVSSRRVTRLNGVIDGAAFGVAAAVTRDLDADGYADLLVGAAGAREQRGAVYVFHGSARGVSAVPRAVLSDPDGRPQDWFGQAVSGGGDIDGDGFADVVVGAGGADRGGRDWGAVFVFRGGRHGVAAEPDDTIDSPVPQDDDHFGFALDSSGDFNQDGYADLLAGGPGIDVAGQVIGRDRGAVYVFPGGPEGALAIPTARLQAPVPVDLDRFGYAVANAGDLDGDGFDDVAVGAPGADDAASDTGSVYVFRGGASGVAAVPGEVLRDPRAGPYERFGTSVAGVGDVNGDGLGDLLIGTSGPERGRGSVFHGGREGLSPMPRTVLHDPLGPGYNHFAESLAGAGDVDGDGRNDIVVGASGSDNGGTYRGSAVLYPGTADGVEARSPLRIDNPDTGRHDHFGHAVAGGR